MDDANAVQLQVPVEDPVAKLEEPGRPGRRAVDAPRQAHPSEVHPAVAAGESTTVARAAECDVLASKGLDQLCLGKARSPGDIARRGRADEPCTRLPAQLGTVEHVVVVGVPDQDLVGVRKHSAMRSVGHQALAEGRRQIRAGDEGVEDDGPAPTLDLEACGPEVAQVHGGVGLGVAPEDSGDTVGRAFPSTPWEARRGNEHACGLSSEVRRGDILSAGAPDWGLLLGRMDCLSTCHTPVQERMLRAQGSLHQLHRARRLAAVPARDVEDLEFSFDLAGHLRIQREGWGPRKIRRVERRINASVSQPLTYTDKGAVGAFDPSEIRDAVFDLAAQANAPRPVAVLRPRRQPVPRLRAALRAGPRETGSGAARAAGRLPPGSNGTPGSPHRGLH